MIWQSFIDFFSFKDPNVVYVVAGIIFINSSSALVGTFAYLRKRSLLADAVSHALLPGICIGFLFAGEKNMPALITGAFITGWISIYLVDLIVRKSRIKQDAAIAMVISFFFAIGIVLLTYIQKHGNGNHAGLDHFLFGQAAAISKYDVMLFAIVFVVILFAVVLLYKNLVILSFNPDFAQSVGIPVRFIEFFLTSLTVLAIAIGIQALGVILISALIITPAATARMWTHHLKKMILIAILISVFSGIAGSFVSYTRAQMPTGPWVVVILSLITFVSVVLAPKGLLRKFIVRRRNENKINDENILKTIFELKGFTQTEKNPVFSTIELTEKRLFDTKKLDAGLRRLIRRDLIAQKGDQFELTASGKKEAARIIKLHRLWEQYLLKRTRIDTDHVHSGAEAIEHIITAEIEKELEKELGIEGIPEEDY